MASWLKSAEELLHKVDKTAKAVHSVALQQQTTGGSNAPDLAQPSNISATPDPTTDTDPSSSSTTAINTNMTAPQNSKPAAAKPQNTAAAAPIPSKSLSSSSPLKTTRQQSSSPFSSSSQTLRPSPFESVPTPPPVVAAAETVVIDGFEVTLPSVEQPIEEEEEDDDDEEEQQQQQSAAAAVAAAIQTTLKSHPVPPTPPPSAVSDLALNNRIAAVDNSTEQPAATKQNVNNSTAPHSTTTAAADKQQQPQPKKTDLPATASTDSLTLAETTTSTSTNERESRLLRAVDALKKKVTRLEQENQQLEDLLSRADAEARGGNTEISKLEDALAKEQAARISAQAALAQAAAAKDAATSALHQQLDELKTQVEKTNTRLIQVEKVNEELVEEKKVSEGALLSAVRREMESVEAQLQEERTAHAATRRASAAREQQLDASLADASHALSAMQRALDDRNSKLAQLEERCVTLEGEHDTLQLQLTQAEAKVQQLLDDKGGNSSAFLNNNNIADIATYVQQIEELEATLAASKARITHLETTAISTATENATLKEELQHLRLEVSSLKAVDVDDLKKRLREVSDALYLKQTQLERATADQAATRLALERQVNAARAEAQQVRRRQSATDKALIAAEDGVVPTDVVLGEHTISRLANAGQWGSVIMAAVKLLDDSASQSMRVLRRYPLARLLVLVYVLFIHMFCYALLHRLQHKAFHAMELELELAASNGGGGDVLHHG